MCRSQHRASSLQSSEDIIDCLPELIDYVDGHHERLESLVETTLSSTQIDQVSCQRCIKVGLTLYTYLPSVQ